MKHIKNSSIISDLYDHDGNRYERVEGQEFGRRIVYWYHIDDTKKTEKAQRQVVPISTHAELERLHTQTVGETGEKASKDNG